MKKSREEKERKKTKSDIGGIARGKLLEHQASIVAATKPDKLLRKAVDKRNHKISSHKY